MSVTFADPGLVPKRRAGQAGAGLEARGRPADRQRVRVTGPGRANAGAKALTVVGTMLAGDDFIDDCDVLRTVAGPVVFNDIRAPSTIGTFLRCFT